MTTVAFQQVDVFTQVPFKGNPVAVVLDGDALSTETMQAIASWTNLSETTFVCVPTDARADYRLRIFTPRSELPFAGHPTIGSAHAVLRHGRLPKTPGRLVQECGRGLIDIAIDGERLLLALPEPSFRPLAVERLDRVVAALGVAPGAVRRAAVVDVGPVWLTIELATVADVVGLRPDLARLVEASTSELTGGVTVFGFYAPDAETAVEVRSFAPAHGIAEDPVCGSGNGCVAAIVRRDRLIDADGYVAGQGRCLGRDGRVTVRFAADAIWLGGDAVTCVEGSLTT